MSKTCRSPRFSPARGTSSDARVRGAAIRPIAIRSTPAACTTWAIWRTTAPWDLRVLYSQHGGSRCRKYFNADLSDLAAPNSLYPHRVVAVAVRLVVEDGLRYPSASWHLWRDHRVFVPLCHP